VDGDSPAAMRYTEARIAPITNHLLSDIHKDTVDFSLNFDDSLEEPVVLPAAFPNMLVNGATGIAVGMSTSIPPHNLGEVVDALKYMLLNWTRLDTVTVENLFKFIKGPDFPTGGTIIQDVSKDGGLIRAYGTGRGRIRVRANVHIEEMSRGRHRLLVTELPYMTNKSTLIERIANLARDGKLEGIADLRDESDRQGMRIVIELTKTVDPKQVLLELFNRTPMQSTFSIIMLALVDGEPRLLSLKQSLRVYIQHRLDMIRLRSEYDLRKAREKAHILEGLRVALKNLDSVIDIIRRSRTAETAHSKLKSRFKLSDQQVKAILDMPLRRLASLERKKIEDDYRSVKTEIRRLEALLRSPKKVRGVVIEELEAVKQEYADRRKTRIVSINGKQSEEDALTITDLAPERKVWVMISKDGYISRTLGKKPPRLGGSDAPQALLKVNTRDTIYLVTEQGEASTILVHSLPEGLKPSDGAPIAQITPFAKKDKFSAAFTLPPKADQAEDWYVIACTRGGMVKKTSLSELPGPSAKAFTIIKVNQGDRLGWIRLSDGKKDIFLVTSQGMAIRFNEEDVRPMGLVAAGVMGIKLKIGDDVVGMELFPRTGELFLPTAGSAHCRYCFGERDCTSDSSAGKVRR
jgi:DNA gyrase subunit A